MTTMTVAGAGLTVRVSKVNDDVILLNIRGETLDMFAEMFAEQVVGPGDVRSIEMGLGREMVADLKTTLAELQTAIAEL